MLVDDTIRSAVEEAITDSLKNLTIQKRLYTIAEAADYLGRSPDAVGRMVREGHLEVSSHDTKILIDVLELDANCERVKHLHEAAA